MVLDLTLEQDLRILLQLLRSESKRIALVFISAPCGTASKARERPIKTSLLFGQKQPEPQANLTKRICCLAWTRSRLNWPTNCMRQSLPSFWIAIKLG